MNSSFFRVSSDRGAKVNDLQVEILVIYPVARLVIEVGNVTTVYKRRGRPFARSGLRHVKPFVSTVSINCMTFFHSSCSSLSVLRISSSFDLRTGLCAVHTRLFVCPVADPVYVRGELWCKR